MSDEAAPEDAPGLVIDEVGEKFEAFQALRKSDTAAADEVLHSLGAEDEVDRDIVLEVSAPRPLGHPDRFPEAHRLAIRSLEVLDRNGRRGITVHRLGPLNPIAGFLAQQMTQLIIRMHQSNLVEHIVHLYERREANAADDDPQKVLLTRARIQMTRIAPGFKRNALQVPLFVIGGAVAGTALSALQRAAVSALSTVIGRIIGTLVVGLLIGIIAWIILRGAAVARRRIHLTTDPAMKALWETIGRCGKPPQDPSRVFALIGLILALLPWLLIPLGLAASWVSGLF